MSQKYGPSASILVWGLGTLVGGTLASIWAWLSSIENAAADLGRPAGVKVLVVLGVVAAVVGLIILLVGVWQLATNVDIAALASQEAAAQVELDQERDHERADRSYSEAAREVDERWKERLKDEPEPED